MTAFGLALVLTAACCHAVWNLLVKKLNAGPELIWLFSVVTIVLYAPVAAAILITAAPRLDAWALGFITGSAALHLAYFTLLQRGYRFGDLSIVYPTARATGPLLSTTFAVIVLGESLTIMVALGGIAIIVGVLGLTGGFRRIDAANGRSILFGLAVGAIIGTYTVWDAYAVATLLVSPVLLDYFASTVRAVVLLPLAHRRRVEIKILWREHRLSVCAIALFNPLAYILVLYALTFTPVIYVAPAREVSVMITVVLGSVLLGEGHLKNRLAWSAFILTGLACLAVA